MLLLSPYCHQYFCQRCNCFEVVVQIRVLYKFNKLKMLLCIKYFLIHLYWHPL